MQGDLYKHLVQLLNPKCVFIFVHTIGCSSSVLPEVSNVEGPTSPCQLFTNQMLLNISSIKVGLGKVSSYIFMIGVLPLPGLLLNLQLPEFHVQVSGIETAGQGCNPFLGVETSKTYWDKTTTLLDGWTPTWACKPAAKPATWAAASWSMIVTQHNRRHTLWKTNW